MTELLSSFLVGIAFGGIMTWLGLPLPAPTALAGILGIVGVFIGFILIKQVI